MHVKKHQAYEENYIVLLVTGPYLFENDPRQCHCKQKL